MVQTQARAAAPGANFREHFVDFDGFHIRYMEAGSGPPLVWFHGAGGLHLTHGHDLLAEQYRVIAVEVPGFGDSAVNERSRDYPALGATLAGAIGALGVERFSLWGTSFGGRVAFWTAVGAADRIDALVLEAPGAILPDGWNPVIRSPEEFRTMLFAHPERNEHWQPTPPQIADKQRKLLAQLGNPSREDTEQAMTTLGVPTLVVFGTRDALIPPEMGRVYREKMPNCNYVLVYDAGHEIGADRPEAFASLVSDFLARREAFIVNQKSSLINP
jgi:pimeloyl-ACP methyl ester carboxylesterase